MNKHVPFSDATTKLKSLISTSFLMLFMILTSSGQSLTIVAFDSIVSGDAIQSNALYARVSIQNTSSQALDIKVKRIDGNYTALTDSNAICWGICHLPSASVSNMAISIPAGGIDSLHFTGHVYPDQNGVPASGDITYVFFDVHDPTDTLAIIIHYEVGLTLELTEVISNRKVKLYPNPASDFLTLEFETTLREPFTFEIYNGIGSMVLEKEVTGNQASHQINLEHLQNGLYFFRLSKGNYVHDTGKLIIR